jgi:hypothetical protein
MLGSADFRCLIAWVKRAEDILKHNGAEDISSVGEKAASTHGVTTESASIRTADKY